MRGGEGEERGGEVVAGAAGQLRKLQFESSVLPGANTGTLSVWTKNIHLDSFVPMKSRFHPPANDFF